MQRGLLQEFENEKGKNAVLELEIKSLLTKLNNSKAGTETKNMENLLKESEIIINRMKGEHQNRVQVLNNDLLAEKEKVSELEQDVIAKRDKIRKRTIELEES